MHRSHILALLLTLLLGLAWESPAEEPAVSLEACGEDLASCERQWEPATSP